MIATLAERRTDSSFLFSAELWQNAGSSDFCIYDTQMSNE